MTDLDLYGLPHPSPAADDLAPLSAAERARLFRGALLFLLALLAFTVAFAWLYGRAPLPDDISLPGAATSEAAAACVRAVAAPFA